MGYFPGRNVPCGKKKVKKWAKNPFIPRFQKRVHYFNEHTDLDGPDLRAQICG
jgi:hypothetical protein